MNAFRIRVKMDVSCIDLTSLLEFLHQNREEPSLGFLSEGILVLNLLSHPIFVFWYICLMVNCSGVILIISTG